MTDGEKKFCKICNKEIVRAEWEATMASNLRGRSLVNQLWVSKEYCSDACRKLSKNQIDKRYKKACKNCGKEFHKKMCISLKYWEKESKFCSMSCMQEYYAIRKLAKLWDVPLDKFRAKLIKLLEAGEFDLGEKK
jgi:hypothetical protein